MVSEGGLGNCGCTVETGYISKPPENRVGHVCWWHRNFSKRKHGDSVTLQEHHCPCGCN
jgi:hypothetical protein